MIRKRRTHAPRGKVMTLGGDTIDQEPDQNDGTPTLDGGVVRDGEDTNQSTWT